LNESSECEISKDSKLSYFERIEIYQDRERNLNEGRDATNKEVLQEQDNAHEEAGQWRNHGEGSSF